MDSKNYNVDDILAEIKNRKIREKKTDAGSVSSAPVHTEPRPEPKPQVAPQPQATPLPRAEVRQEPRPQAAPQPRAEVRQEPRPQAAPQPRAEVRQEPRPQAAPQPRAEVRQEPRPQATIQPRTDANPRAEKSRESFDDFKFELPKKEEKKSRNPLEFDADVRSITDRAKARTTATQAARPALQRFEFITDVKPENTASLQKSAVMVEDQATSSFPPAIGKKAEKVGMDRTRVIPAISPSRDIKAEDVHKMDFSKLAAESQTGFYIDDEIGDDRPTGAVIDYSEYNSTSDRRDVQTDIARVKLWLFVRVSLTVLLTAVLLVLTLAGKHEGIPLPEMMWPVPDTMRMYLIACTVFTILVALVNSSTVGGGLMGLFKMNANSDTLVACATLAAVGQGVVMVSNPSIVDPSGLNLYFCIAAVAMLFNNLGKLSMIDRILSNFKIIASDQTKRAVLSVDSDEFCHEFFKDTTRRPTIAHSVRAGFFTDFLALSYSDKYDVGMNRAVAPVSLAGSVVVGVVTYFLTGSVLSAVSALTAILCVCATLSSTFIENIPLAKLAKKLTPQGAMVSGNKAVEDFCDAKAIVLTETDLFPRGNVQMLGIRAFSQARIDEAILDAASVLCDIDGALGPVFLDMIGGNKKLLKKVDSIVFENAMGISAWVDGRRVLIGNRRLMVNHGISLPQEVLEHKQISTEAEPLFLSNSGEACAQFTVGYVIDEDLAMHLDKMALSEKLLIVHTTDANITAEKLWELYGYPHDLIKILPAEWHARYKTMAAPRETAIAEIVYTGKATTMLKAILGCMAARSSILSATVIQLIQIVLGYALCTFLAFMGQVETLTVLEIGAYQLFWFLAIFIVQQVRQS